MHCILRKPLAKASLPVCEEKYINPSLVECELITFIGCHKDLLKCMVIPMPDKISKASVFVTSIKLHDTIPLRTWKSLIGKLLVCTTLNRPILSAFDKVYKGIPRRQHNSLAITPPKDPRFTPIDAHITELEHIISIAPLSAVPLDLPFSPTVLAFDALHIADAVAKTTATPEVLTKLFKLSAM